MSKALNLKMESARKKHAGSVLEFKEKLVRERPSLPFKDEYIDVLLGEINEFERRFRAIAVQNK